MIFIAWIAIVFAGLGVIVGPFLIGEPRKPYSASNYVAVLLESAMVIALAGRVIGWW